MTGVAAAGWPRDRIVALAGGRNFRDLGGYPAADGRHVRWGVLFRAGVLTGLTAQDRVQLDQRGLRAICDLRTVREREAAPFVAPPGVAWWGGDRRASFADLRETMRAGFPTPAAARAGMIAGYRALPLELAGAYRQLFAHLRAGEVPLLFHCVAGKDRAGTAAALVLTALGVPRDTVVADYALTNDVYDVARTLLAKHGADADGRPPGVVTAVAMADPAYIAAALETITQGPGGLAGYLHDRLGIDATDLAAIRDLLLE